MHLTFRGVNDAFRGLVQGFHDGSIPTTKRPSRYGNTLTVEEPVTVTYTHPRERVLFNPQRDANPFFHLYEALWMLAGRNDVAPLAYYNSKIAEIASDDGQIFNGAYGFRWRNTPRSAAVWLEEAEHHENLYTLEDAEIEDVDQLKIIIEQLRNKPESRRVVLQMWNVEDDLLKMDTSKDLCCNVCAFFALREKEEQHLAGHILATCEAQKMDRVLDMTVINRSNDLVWGMLGANVVHFSLLQEYIAGMIGVEVGKYHQVTNNLHVYTANWKPEEWLADYNDDVLGQSSIGTLSDQWYHSEATIEGEVETAQPLVLDGYTKIFDRQCADFVELHKDGAGYTKVDSLNHRIMVPDFFSQVAEPICMTWHAHKRRDTTGVKYWLSQIHAEDWRVACADWIERRERRAARSKEV